MSVFLGFVAMWVLALVLAHIEGRAALHSAGEGTAGSYGAPAVPSSPRGWQ